MISVNRRRSNVPFEPLQLGLKPFDLLLDVRKLLRPSTSAVHKDRLADQYLVMLDECGHPAEGGLEGKEPIRRLSGLSGDDILRVWRLCRTG